MTTTEVIQLSLPMVLVRLFLIQLIFPQVFHIPPNFSLTLFLQEWNLPILAPNLP